ncbi:MAG: 30S ribosomal protein S3 [Candidatus Aenigmatarchaeota archaeon]
MIEKKFIRENLRLSEVDEFLAREFARAGYSHSDIHRTPLSIRITVYAQRPGMVIGRGGKTIDAISQVLKERFGIENPQLDVQEIENPDLDANIVAKQIAAAIERGLKYKRVASLALTRIMEAGAVGAAIRIGGKVGGEMGRTEKFSAGYLKFAGEPAEKLSKAYATAQVKLGTIGVQVRILIEPPKEIEAMKKLGRKMMKEEEEKPKEEEKKGEKKKEE